MRHQIGDMITHHVGKMQIRPVGTTITPQNGINGVKRSDTDRKNIERTFAYNLIL